MLLVSLAALQASAAGIVVRDDGEEGLVFSDAVADAAPASAPGHDGAAAPALSSQRRARRFAPLVKAAAAAHDLPEALLRAVIEVESNFDADARSPRGALGLMQLMPATARSLGVDNAREPAANVNAGARYLKDLLARYGNDVPLALAAYNAGPQAVRSSGGIPRFAETQAYVPRVLLRYHKLQSAE